MTNTRGIYLLDGSATTFLPTLKVSAAIKILNTGLNLPAEKLEKLTDGLYTLVANYDMAEEYCWLKLSTCLQSGHCSLKWGVSPIIKSLNLSNEAIAAVYYAWKQSNCTPEEACKVLNVSMQDLLDLSAQFDRASL